MAAAKGKRSLLTAPILKRLRLSPKWGCSKNNLVILRARMKVKADPQPPGPNFCIINNTRGKLEKLGSGAGKLGRKVGAKRKPSGTYFRTK